MLLETQNYTKHFKCGALENNDPSFLEINVVPLETITQYFSILNVVPLKTGVFVSKSTTFSSRKEGSLFPKAPHLNKEIVGQCFQRHHI